MESSSGPKQAQQRQNQRLRVQEEEILASNGAPAEGSLLSLQPLRSLSNTPLQPPPPLRSSASAASTGGGALEVKQDKEEESLCKAPLQPPPRLANDQCEEAVSNDQRQPPRFSNDQRQRPHLHLFRSRDRSSASAASSDGVSNDQRQTPRFSNDQRQRTHLHLFRSRDRTSASAASSEAGPSEVKDKEAESPPQQVVAEESNLLPSVSCRASADPTKVSCVKSTGSDHFDCSLPSIVPSALLTIEPLKAISTQAPPAVQEYSISEKTKVGINGTLVLCESKVDEVITYAFFYCRVWTDWEIAASRDDIEVVAVNDPFADAQYMAYMLKNESTDGTFEGSIEVVNDSTLEINGKKITVTSKRDPKDIPWGNFGAEYVVESSGFFTTIEKASGDARKVAISAPSADAPMFLVGVNEMSCDPKMKVVSNASCTNSFPTSAKVVYEGFGTIEGLMTTVYAMIGQKTVDVQEGICPSPLSEHLVLSRGQSSASASSSVAGASEVKKDKEEESTQQVVEGVNLPPEIILEILSRLPARFINRFLAMSKSWHTVISSDKKLRQAFAGFFYHTYDFFRKPRIMRCFASIYGQQTNPSLDFLPKYWGCNRVDTCQGLLLCHCNKTPDSSGESSYIVCNPATRRWVELPPSPTRGKIPGWAARLGFDPAVSPHFHVFEFLDEAEVLTISGVNIYSSEVARWMQHKSRWNHAVGLPTDSRSVFVNDRLHLVTHKAELVSVDTKGEAWRVFSGLTVQFIGLSQGSLHCVTARSDANVIVLCLEVYDSNTWFCKLDISKRQLCDNLGEDWRIIGIHPDYDNLFLATADDTKLASCRMELQQLRHIIDLEEEAQGQYFPYVPIFSEESPGLQSRQ